VDKGALHNVVNGADTLLSQGEMMLYAPGIWHMQYADLDVEPSFITVSFDLSGDVPEHLFNRKIPLGAESAALLRRMLDEREKNASYSGELILCSLQMLLLTVLQSGERQEARLKTPASLHSENSIVNAALSFVSAHITKNSPYLIWRSAAMSAPPASPRCFSSGSPSRPLIISEGQAGGKQTFDPRGRDERVPDCGAPELFQRAAVFKTV
jgi:hypothetical protein